MTAPPALRLAGEIAAQFRHLPTDEAADKVAHHIRMFWDPRMRAQLHQLAGAAGPGTDPVVGRVVELLGDG